MFQSRQHKHDRFIEELRAESRYGDTFSTIKLDISFHLTEDELNTIIHHIISGTAIIGPQLQTACTIVHECAHYWHWIGSSLGFHASKVTFAQTALTQFIIHNLNESGWSVLPIPLLDANYGSQKTAKLQDINAAIELWRALETYRRSYLMATTPDSSGDTETFARVVTLVNIALTQLDFERPVTQQPLAELLDKTFHGRSFKEPFPYIHPRIQRVDERYVLSPRVILEGAAFLAEMDLLRFHSVGDILEQVGRHIEGAYNSLYGVALEYIFHREPRLAGNPKLVSHLLDLALMSPSDGVHFPPLYRAGREIVDWSDLHPGIRLHLMLSTITNKSLPDPKAQTEIYVDFIENLCHDLGWPTPTAIASYARQFFVLHETEAEDGKRLAINLNINSFNEIYHRHFKAMDYRSQKPGAFLDLYECFAPLFGGGQHLVNYFRPTMATRDGAYIMDPALFSPFLVNYACRCIANGTVSALIDAIDLGKRYLEPSMGPMTGPFVDFVMVRNVGATTAQFVPLAEWSAS